jgi:predicted Zn-dependent protease
MNKIIFAIVVAAVATSAAPVAAKKLPKGDQATVSKAVTKEIVDAMAEELERSMTMRVPGAPKPYFISYKLTEVEVNDATATLGSVTAKGNRHFVSLEAHVHVGNYASDNTNFVISQAESVDGIATAQLPLEATPATARKVAWMTTDQAYKEAVQQFTAKQEALRSGSAPGAAQSYSKAKPLVMETPVLVNKLKTKQALVTRAERLSSTFRNLKNVRDSRVAFTSFLERRWYLNSEGTSSHDTRRVSGVMIVASGQANDGQELNLYYRRYGHASAHLPSDKVLTAEAKKLAKQLGDLAKAPLVDSYTGPVLFEGDGAVGIVRSALSPHLTGTPPPVGSSAQDAQVFGGAFAERLGRKITSKFLSIADDPSTHHSNKVPVIGGYRFDDEGIRAQRISIVEKGMLKTLPMSRTPSSKIAESNGHARRSVAGGLFRGSPTNLFIKAEKGKTRKQLIKDLMAAVKDEGLDYGIIVRQFDDVAITANPELSRPEVVNVLRNTDPNAPPIATLAYRVFPDGREELIRGVQLERVEVNSWRNLLAAGKNITIRNFLAPADPLIFLQVAGGDEGFVPSAGVESSITVPDLLFKELSIGRSTAKRRPKPPIPRP